MHAGESFETRLYVRLAFLQQLPQQYVQVLPEQLTLAPLFVQLTAMPLPHDVARLVRMSLSCRADDISEASSVGAALV